MFFPFIALIMFMPYFIWCEQKQVQSHEVLLFSQAMFSMPLVHWKFVETHFQSFNNQTDCTSVTHGLVFICVKLNTSTLTKSIKLPFRAAVEQFVL